MADIFSMTGFGRCERITEQYRVLAEIRSVNHRYLDLGIKMPRRFNCFEAEIRSLVKSYIERGKTDLYIAFEDYADGTKKLVYNETLAAEYMDCAGQIRERFGIQDDMKVSTLMRMPEVLSMEEQYGDDELLWKELEPALTEALAAFLSARKKEGDALREDILQKLVKMEAYVAEIEAFSPSVVEEYRRRLSDKIRETLSENGSLLEESRIITEAAIFADKVCTDEEMVRLKSHIATMQKKLRSGGACGRELDFIAQEMNREANTTLSKANHLRIADTAIALKTEIEKIREQVQNIE